MKTYDSGKIEKKWQRVWEKTNASAAKNTSKKLKFYGLIEFPYPSGIGLHIGHIRSNTAMDIIVRKRRAEGFNALYPIGWDAFGLPTENFAIKSGIHPAKVTKDNTANFRRQLKSLGFSFDWDREINTTDPAYYKWTQWIFLQLYKHNLAYKSKMPINWCLSCKIGLANEEVVNGECERCGGPTEKREKEQWMLAITKYADRLDKDLDTVDYLEKIKIQQRNWIGKSEGAEITFDLVAANNASGKKAPIGSKQTPLEKATVFTTRPDTLFGVTYLVIAPEHELLFKLKDNITNWKDVTKYAAETAKKPEMDRMAENKEKTGVKIEGITAINPANGEAVPLFAADYVLSTYGTGIIMAVPAHDDRDHAFAEKFRLPIRTVIEALCTQTTEPGKVRPGMPFDERDAIIAIVKHWSENKYIGLKWKQVAWGTLITGGIEKGQTAEEAAKMEIREETGYLNPKLVNDFGMVHSKFYHVPKKTNRFGHSRILEFKLENDAREKMSEAENDIHEILWLTEQEMEHFLTADSHQYALRVMTGKEKFYTGEGRLVNSGQFDKMESAEAKKEITKFVKGKKAVSYKLRDWVFSRQRYWGEPIPIIHCEKCGMVPVPEKDLPVELPNIKNYTPTDAGESPLAGVSAWVNVKCPTCKGKARRETDTMPNWAGSSWYFLRYTDAHNTKAFASKKALDYWTPVDWYNGGMEHTTLHLLYSRFWHKFLFDIGEVPTPEPYQKRTSHGLILAGDGSKISKSKGNGISPDDVVKAVGADALRLYEMFMGPFDQAVAWDDRGVVGTRRFIERVFKAHAKVSANKKFVDDTELESVFQQTVKKVGEDIETMKFNTAVSQMMILLNEIEKADTVSKNLYATFIRLLAPFAPHVTEELWEMLGNKGSVHEAPWPKADESKITAAKRMIMVQVNGKNRGSFTAEKTLSEKQAGETALALPGISKWLEGLKIKRIVYVKDKLVNIVVA